MERVRVKRILRVKLVYQSSKSTVCTFTITKMFGPINVGKKYARKFFSGTYILYRPKIFWMIVNFAFSRSATGNLTASFTKCYSSKNFGLRVTPSVLISLFNFFVTHFYMLLFCLSELLFIYRTFILYFFPHNDVGERRNVV